MNYLTKNDLINLNKQFTSGSAKGHVINEGSLSNAVDGPSRMYQEVETCSTLEEKILALATPLSQNHPFEDGNKRTATAAVNAFLAINGFCIPKQNQERLIAAVNELAAEEPIEDSDFIEEMKAIVCPIQ